MVDSTKNSTTTLSTSERDNLISRIDELERLLARKKAASQQANLPRIKVGTDGIPILIETVNEKYITPDQSQASNTVDKDDQIINDIIDKVDKEISADLDALVLMLKDSIIDEVKARLIEELHPNESKSDKNQTKE